MVGWLLSNTFLLNNISGSTVDLNLKLHIPTVWWKADATTNKLISQRAAPGCAEYGDKRTLRVNTAMKRWSASLLFGLMYMVVCWWCYLAERSRDGLDTRYDDQHDQCRPSSFWCPIFVAAHLYSASCSVCCFPRHLRRVPLPRLQTPTSCLWGICLLLLEPSFLHCHSITFDAVWLPGRHKRVGPGIIWSTVKSGWVAQLTRKPSWRKGCARQQCVYTAILDFWNFKVAPLVRPSPKTPP